MNTLQIIGILMITTPFIAISIWFAREEGILPTIALFLGLLALIFWFGVGAYLIEGGF